MLVIQATDPEAARNLPIPTLMNFEINSPFAQTNGKYIQTYFIITLYLFTN